MQLIGNASSKSSCMSFSNFDSMETVHYVRDVAVIWRAPSVDNSINI